VEDFIGGEGTGIDGAVALTARKSGESGVHEMSIELR